MTNPIEDYLGVSVSHGTLRKQDLIPTFHGVLEGLAPSTPGMPDLPPNADMDTAVAHGDDHEWWYSEDASEYLGVLMEALDYASPCGYYFGAHEGDGSDFGFWQIPESL